MGKFLDLFPLSGVDGVTIVKKTKTVVIAKPKQDKKTISFSVGIPSRVMPAHTLIKPRKSVQKKTKKQKPKELVNPKDTLALLSNEREPKMERMIIPTIAASILGAMGSLDADAATNVREPQAVTARATQSAAAKDYTVRGGDTVSGIIKRFKMSMKQFKELNPDIKDLNKIKVGQTVKVTSSGEQKKIKPSQFSLTNLAVDAVKTWEKLGKRNDAGLCIPYYDKVGKVWTIGYGTTYYPNGTKVKPTDKPITKEKALEYAKNYLNRIVKRLKLGSKTDLTEGQLAALVSFGYNAGEGRIGTICKRYLSKGDTDGALEYMKSIKYGADKGEPSPGLVKRRRAEEILWDTGKITQF